LKKISVLRASRVRQMRLLRHRSRKASEEVMFEPRLKSTEAARYGKSGEEIVQEADPAWAKALWSGRVRALEK
jgi:hypothetical protein